MTINEYDWNIKLLVENINKVYQSVICVLAPLDRSKVPPTNRTQEIHESEYLQGSLVQI